jgi:hypothetical protein
MCGNDPIFARKYLETPSWPITLTLMKNLAGLILILGLLSMAACNSAPPRVTENAVLERGGRELAHSSTRQQKKVVSERNFHGETLFLVGRDSFRQMGTTYYWEAPRIQRSVSSLPSFNGGITNVLSPTGLRKVYGEPNEVSADGRSWRYWISGKP